MAKKPRKKSKDRPLHYLRHWREYRHMTQEDLANKVGTTKGVISLLESGERRFSDKWARRLAPLLKVQAGWLLDHDPESLPTSVLEIWANIPADRHTQALEVLRTFQKKAS
jgi:transcriptional regulator with XRE-family HTH domain